MRPVNVEERFPVDVSKTPSLYTLYSVIAEPPLFIGANQVAERVVEPGVKDKNLG